MDINIKSKKPSLRIAEILRENILIYTDNKLTNDEANICAIQMFLDEEWERINKLLEAKNDS